LSGTHIHAVYASDLARAAQTARHIADPHGLSVATDARLREFAFGQWEGLTWEQIVRRFPEAAQFDFLSVRDYRPPGGETLDVVEQRVGAFLDALHTQDGTAVVVSHAGALHAALAHLFGDAYFEWKVRLMPASITRICLAPDQAPEVISLNELDHLAAQPSA
jgi:broad specificity phosphatase PhoE